MMDHVLRASGSGIHLYGGGDRERDRRTRQWRIARIDRFTQRQRQMCEWINFAEIAEWCSKEDQGTSNNDASMMRSACI